MNSERKTCSEHGNVEYIVYQRVHHPLNCTLFVFPFFDVFCSTKSEYGNAKLWIGANSSPISIQISKFWMASATSLCVYHRSAWTIPKCSRTSSTIPCQNAKNTTPLMHKTDHQQSTEWQSNWIIISLKIIWTTYIWREPDMEPVRARMSDKT